MRTVFVEITTSVENASCLLRMICQTQKNLCQPAAIIWRQVWVYNIEAFLALLFYLSP